MEVYLSLGFLILLSVIADGLTEDETITQNKQTPILEDASTPLFLTPLLERKSFAEAREKARVHHSQLRDFESYSGYLTVNKEFNSNLFFWYFPSKGNSTTDPLILWLQGGPGQSSLIGLLLEHGPFEIVNHKEALQLRNITWVNNHNVLYIDSPVGSGFSFTDNESGYATSTEAVVDNVYAALLQFFELFPELRKNDFYAMGESFGGKYVPVLSHKIHTANGNHDADCKINLVGLAIGSGWTDPVNQLDYSNYFYHVGLVDENGREEVRKIEGEIKDLIREERYVEAFNKQKSLLFGYDGYLSNVSGYYYLYNYLENTEPSRFYWFQLWLHHRAVRKALHVGNNNYVVASKTVNNYMVSAFLKSVAHLMPTLIEHYRVLLFYGQLDIIGPYPNAVNYVKKLDWPGAEEYDSAVRKLWFVDKQLAGYAKSARNLTVVLVRNAGHMVPSDQPLWAWKMISLFTRNESLV